MALKVDGFLVDAKPMPRKDLAKPQNYAFKIQDADTQEIVEVCSPKLLGTRGELVSVPVSANGYTNRSGVVQVSFWHFDSNSTEAAGPVPGFDAPSPPAAPEAPAPPTGFVGMKLASNGHAKEPVPAGGN